jgi:hypothetical protein
MLRNRDLDPCLASVCRPIRRRMFRQQILKGDERVVLAVESGIRGLDHGRPRVGELHNQLHRARECLVPDPDKALGAEGADRAADGLGLRSRRPPSVVSVVGHIFQREPVLSPARFRGRREAVVEVVQRRQDSPLRSTQPATHRPILRVGRVNAYWRPS